VTTFLYELRLKVFGPDLNPSELDDVIDTIEEDVDAAVKRFEGRWPDLEFERES
jgi:hypothetical protein